MLCTSSGSGGVHAGGGGEDGVDGGGSGGGGKPGGGKRKFMTRHKLERGSIAAFRREARHIIERDLHFSHRDNIIRVWADKGQTGLIAVANRTTGSVFKVKHFDLQFKYFFQVSLTKFLTSKHLLNFCLVSATEITQQSWLRFCS